MDEGSRQIRSVPLEKGLALRAVYTYLVWICRFQGTPRNLTMKLRASALVYNVQPSQNWCRHEESDCLIKTKHCDERKRCSRNVISAQCSECHCEEIRISAGKRRE